MADARALTLQGGRYTQIQDADELQVGGGIDRATAGTLTIGSAVATQVNLGAATAPVAFTGAVGPAGNTDITFVKEQNHALSVVTSTTVNANGGNFSTSAGTADGTGTGGLLTLLSGASGGASGTSGDARLDVGAPAGGTPGTLLLGNTNAVAITLGGAGTTTTCTGTLAVTTLSTANVELTNTAGAHHFSIATGNAASSLEVYSANTTAAASGSLTLKSGNALGGVSGAVNVISGTSDTGASGGVNINVGVGTGSNGSIGIGNGGAAPALITIGQATTPLTVASAATFSAAGTALSVTNNATVTGTLTNTGGIYANGGVDRSTAATLTLAGTTANQVDIAPASNSACTTVNLGNGSAMTTAHLFTGAAMTTINLGTSMGAGDAINIGGAGCDVNINGNLDVIGTSEFDQNVVIGDGVGGPDTLAFHSAADPNGGYLGSIAMPNVRWLYETNHQFYVANSSTATAAGGDLAIAAGKGATTGTGGLMSVKGGAGDTIATGGGLDLYSGAGGGTSGASGAVNLKSGTTTSGATGIVTVASGAATAGNTGLVTLISGNATSGNSGNVAIDVGTASGTLGTVILGGTNATAITLGHSGTTTTVPSGATLDLVVGSTLTLAGFVNEAVNAINTGTVTSTNLNTLTNGSNADALHTHASGSATFVSFTATSGAAVTQYSLVAMNNSGGNPRAYMADANGATPLNNPVGITRTAAGGAGTSLTVQVAGELAIPDALWDGVPAVGDVGKLVFMSTTAGNFTITAPSTSGDTVQKVGIVSVGGAGAVKIVVQIGDGVTL